MNVSKAQNGKAYGMLFGESRSVYTPNIHAHRGFDIKRTYSYITAARKGAGLFAALT